MATEIQEFGAQTSPGWVTRARDAWRTVKAREDERRAELDRQLDEIKRREAEERAAGFAQALRELLGEVVDVQPGQIEVVLNGYTFRAAQLRWDPKKHQQRTTLHLVKPCSRCGEIVLSKPLDTLEQLGYELELEYAHEGACPTVKGEDSDGR